jgi:hypothetical protein
MRWRFVGSRPVSALADKVMKECGDYESKIKTKTNQAKASQSERA